MTLDCAVVVTFVFFHIDLGLGLIELHVISGLFCAIGLTDYVSVFAVKGQ